MTSNGHSCATMAHGFFGILVFFLFFFLLSASIFIPLSSSKSSISLFLDHPLHYTPFLLFLPVGIHKYTNLLLSVSLGIILESGYET